jgi:hypothetical protein
MFRKFMDHIVPGVIKPLHSLWNEIIGFLFFCLMVAGVVAVVREIRAFDQTVSGLARIALPGLFVLVMGYFCASSFLKARKISRS